MNTPMIRVRNLYKIFGATPARVLPMVRDKGPSFLSSTSMCWGCRTSTLICRPAKSR